MPDLETMRCDWCGKEFPADARACVEAGIEAIPPEGDEWKEWQPLEVTDEQRAAIGAVMGLDEAEVATLVTTGNVEGLGAIVCVQCQDSAEEAE